MLRVIAGLTALVVGATIVLAQNTGAIKQRQDLMKANAGAAKEPSAMAKGDAPFDLAKIKASLKAIQEQAAKLKDLWPDDSKTGETRALPAIWETKADFLAGFDKFAADAKAAESAIKDEASLKAELPKVFANCATCHKAYRRAN